MGGYIAVVGVPKTTDITVLASAEFDGSVGGVVFGPGGTEGQLLGPLGQTSDGSGAVALDASGRYALITSPYPDDDTYRVGIFALSNDNSWKLVALPSRAGGYTSEYGNTGKGVALSADGRLAAIYTHYGVFILAAVDASEGQ
jgi:hypothetical protein